MVDCNIWPQFFTPPCTHAFCGALHGASLPWMGWPSLPLDWAHPRATCFGQQTQCKHRELEHWDWLSRATALIVGQWGTSGAEPSHPVTSPHSTMSQPPDTWVCSPMISRTSVTPDTWAINTYPVPWCVFNCYVTKVTDTLYIKTWIGFHQFISCSIITTDKWGQTWAPKMAQHKQKVIDRMKNGASKISKW